MAMPNPLIDRFLDATVLLSCTRTGYQFRRRSFASLPHLRGKKVVITGATSGIGAAAAMELAALGAHLILAVRNPVKAEVVQEAIEAHTPGAPVEVYPLDLASIDSIASGGDAILAAHPTLYALVNNAGALLPAAAQTKDGFDSSFAVNLLGHHLLTQRLLPALARSFPGRVVYVTSGGMYTQKLDLQRLQHPPEPFDGVVAYAQAKRAQMVLVAEYARRVSAADCRFFAMHPGWAATPGVATTLPTFNRLLQPLLRSPAQGADTAVWLVAAPESELTNGGLYFDRQLRRQYVLPGTREPKGTAEELWQLLGRLA
jgi:dehydrogenase/reductase SDR family protein 12